MNSNDVTFAEILSRSVHDMSNSLGILTSVLERARAIEFKDGSQFGSEANIHDLLYEASRVHSDLLHIFQLYQMDAELYQINQEDCDVADFLEEQQAQYQSLLAAQNISMELNGPAHLNWSLDRNLLRGLIQNRLANAARYAEHKIAVHYQAADNYLLIAIDDDSEGGYPEQTFINKANCEQGVNLPQGSVGLGLYYALRIAQMHENHQNGHVGYITVNNSGRLSGGSMTVFLP